MEMREQYEVAFPRKDEKKHKPWYLSKKWWMSMLAFIVPILNHRFGWEMQPEELVAIILPIVVYVAAEAGTDMVKR